MNLLVCFRKIIYLSFCLTSLLLIAGACKKDPTGIVIFGDPYASLDTTSHEFMWEVDTLNSPNVIQILPRAIWGSDTDNVYMVGHSDGYEAQIWHWNGDTWKAFEDQTAYAMNPYDIIGFNKNDIWIVGDWFGSSPPDKKILHWNGFQWSAVESGIYGTRCFSVWGTSSNCIFFGLNNGLITRYDGSRFRVYDTGTNATIVDLYGLSANEVYACGVHRLDKQQPWDSTEYFIFRYDGKNWSVRDYHMETVENGPLPFPFNGLWANYRRLWFGVNGGQVFTRYANGEWEEVFRPVNSVWRLHGTELNNIFAAGYQGSSVYHYNGSTWRNFPELFNIDIIAWAVFAIQDQVFIGGHKTNDRNALIIRGKRKIPKGGDGK